MSADIDIDFADRDLVLKLISHTPARQHNNRRHNSGVYVTDIPRDPMQLCATIDHDRAEELGYFKIDFLNMSVYSLIKDQAYYQQMLDTPPPWDQLWKNPTWASQLVHVGNYTDLLADMKPDSIPRMAAFVSIIRPGKAHLQRQPWEKVFESVWDGDSSQGFVFKKSHAISYAMLVSLHMNLLHTLDERD